MTKRRRQSIRTVLLGLFLCALYSLSAEVLFAQVPQISLPLVPSSATPGSVAPAGPGLTITVKGTGFTSDSVVFWNGNRRFTTFVSSTTLKAVITAEDVELPGTAWVSVSTLSSPFSNVAYFEVTNPANSVSSSRVDFLAGVNPFPVAAGDFNGDGKLDLAVANSGSTTVSILLGNGDGSFQAKVDYPVGAVPHWIAVGDFNGDGKPDLAVANAGSNTVSVLIGNGDGTFQAAVSYPVDGNPYSLAAGDFNGDGKLDLAVANGGSNTVSILLGNGDGTFQPKVDFATGGTPHAVASADFNGDGKLDLAVVNFTSNTVSILLGRGDGTFQPEVEYVTGANPHWVALADLNGDSKVDLVVANYGGGTVSVLLGNGDGTFQPRVDYPTGINPPGVAIEDLNGDGHLDLLVPNQGSNTVSILPGNGDGTFQTKTDYASDKGPSSIVTGDLNGDGKIDFVSGNYYGNSVSIFLQTAPSSVNGAAQLNGGNSFTGNQSVNGSVTATSFFGDGSGLTNVSASNASNANFAISAGDAMTLGGIPATGFAPASGSTNYVAKGGDTMSGTLNLPLNGLIAGVNQLVLSGGNVGIGTTTPDAVSGYTSLHIDNEGAGFGGSFLELTHGSTGAKGRVVMDDHGFLLHALNSEPVKIKSGNFNGGGDPGHIYVSTNGNVGIGTGAPAATLDVNGTANFSGPVTFAAGQTFPGANSATITGVTAGAGLFGGGTTGNVSLSIPAAAVTNSMLVNPSVTVVAGSGLSGGGTVSLGGTTTLSLTGFACAPGTAITMIPQQPPGSCQPFATLASNTFTGTQTMPSITVSGGGSFGSVAGLGGVFGFAGNASAGGVVGVTGSGAPAIIGQSEEASGVAASFNVCNGCPGNSPPLSLYVGPDIIDGANGGSIQFRVGYKGDVTTAGNVTSNGNLSAGGSVTIGTGGTPIAEYVSTTYNLTVPSLTPGTCQTFTTAALNSFTPGASDSIALGTPSTLVSNLGSGIFLMYQAWETTTTASPTITIQVCNPTGVKYKGGASGTIRIDVFKH